MLLYLISPRTPSPTGASTKGYTLWRNYYTPWVEAPVPSPILIGLSILRDIESDQCCTRIAGWDYFAKTR